MSEPWRRREEDLGSRRPPERFAVDADFVEDVFEELGGALLYDVLHPQPGLQVLQEAPQETHEVLGRANSPRDGL